jgi:AcrR family transcriptional regulator
MSPRPRKVTDDQLFASTQAEMMRLGPGELTLAAIARDAGVTAAVLVQRFGSKRNLLLALSKRVAEGAGEMVVTLAKQHRSPLAALRAYGDCTAGMATSPAAFVRSLAYLQIDLTDPDFRKHLLNQARATRAGLRRLIEAASQAGELVPDVNPGQMARTIEALVGGSLISWMLYREGTALNWVRADLNAMLAPYLLRRTGVPRRKVRKKLERGGHRCPSRRRRVIGAPRKRRDLADIAGTWQPDKAVEAALAAQDRVDEDLWQ